MRNKNVKYILLIIIILTAFLTYYMYYTKNVDDIYSCNFIINSIRKQECIADVAFNSDLEKGIKTCSDIEDSFIKDVCFLNLIKPYDNLNLSIKKMNQKICNRVFDFDMKDSCINKMERYHLAVMSQAG